MILLDHNVDHIKLGSGGFKKPIENQQVGALLFCAIRS